MNRKIPVALLGMIAALLIGALPVALAAEPTTKPAADTAAAPGSAASDSSGMIYELRRYTVVQGRMPAMLKRFREHTTSLFEKHGMKNIGYWTPEGPAGETLLIYVLAHESKAAADKSWAGFRADPVWLKVKAESEADSKIVEKVESTFMKPTDFSKLK